MWYFDPLGQLTVTAGRDNCFRTCCLSVRLYFLNLAKENNIRYWRDFSDTKSLHTQGYYIAISLQSILFNNSYIYDMSYVINM